MTHRDDDVVSGMMKPIEPLPASWIDLSWAIAEKLASKDVGVRAAALADADADADADAIADSEAGADVAGAGVAVGAVVAVGEGDALDEQPATMAATAKNEIAIFLVSKTDSSWSVD